jgi:hypothetical protein
MRRRTFYVTDRKTRKVFKYAHGADDPEETLRDSKGYGIGCAVDPKTGDLAVANETLVSQACGDLLIYPSGSGKPIAYQAGYVCEGYSVAYDDSGNLFVAGTTYAAGRYAMAEHPFGKSAFVNVKLDHVPGDAAGLQWDGQFLDAGGLTRRGLSGIYRYSVRAKRGHLNEIVRAYVKEHGLDFVAFWLPKVPFRSRVVAAGFNGSPPALVGEYRFPSGGFPLRSFTYQHYATSIVISDSEK